MITEHFKSIATLIAVEAKARFIGRLWSVVFMRRLLTVL